MLNHPVVSQEEWLTARRALLAFIKDEAGNVFHTYSTYGRGPEELIGTLMILDRTPKGRNENGTMNFVRRHDEYENAPKAHACHAN
jgi:predicted dithiol-disulfide oxidoreductase (DUF899 family)